MKLRKHALLAVGALCLPLALSAQTGKSQPKPKPTQKPAQTTAKSAGKVVTLPSGLKYQDLVVGKGKSPKKGDAVAVHYTGWLTTGKKFDSSKDRGEPFMFPIGTGRVIKGWDEGVMTMKVGGKRKLIIPPNLAYGDQDTGGAIPPGSTLIFEVELLDLR